MCTHKTLHLSSWVTVIIYFAVRYVKELRKEGEKRLSLMQPVAAANGNSLNTVGIWRCKAMRAIAWEKQHENGKEQLQPQSLLENTVSVT